MKTGKGKKAEISIPDNNVKQFNSADISDSMMVLRHFDNCLKCIQF